MEKKVMKLAPNNRRIFAYLIDKIIPFIWFCVVTTAIIKASTVQQTVDPFSMYGFGDDFFDFGMQQPSITIGSIVGIGFISLLYVALLVVQIIFYTKSKTIGKSLMGLQVISSKDGKPLNVWWMLFREWIVKDVSGAIFFLGYIWAFIDKKHRTWHDKICDTYVVDIRETKTYGETIN